MVMKKCKICGKEFDAKGRQVCCSDECKKENKLRNNRKAFKKMHENGYNFHKHYERKVEEAYKEFNLLNDGYNSSLGIGKHGDLEVKQGSVEAEKDEIKYRVNNKKAWAKAEKEMQSLW